VYWLFGGEQGHGIFRPKKKKKKKNKFLNKNGPCTVTAGQMQIPVFKQGIRAFLLGVHDAPPSRTLHIHKSRDHGCPLRCGLPNAHVRLILGQEEEEESHGQPHLVCFFQLLKR
jgi:hypothetical protein